MIGRCHYCGRQQVSTQHVRACWQARQGVDAGGSSAQPSPQPKPPPPTTRTSTPNPPPAAKPAPTPKRKRRPSTRGGKGQKGFRQNPNAGPAVRSVQKQQVTSRKVSICNSCGRSINPMTSLCGC